MCRPRTVTLMELAFYAGFYTDEDMQYLELNPPDVSFPDDVSVQDIWHSFTGTEEEYVARKAKSTAIVSPALRYMQHLISHSIAARALSKNVVGWQDLAVLYSMANKHPINLGYTLAFFFNHEATYGLAGAIGGAYYITRIAKGLRAWNDLPPMEQVTTPSYITRASMVSFHLLRSIGKAPNRRFRVTTSEELRKGKHVTDDDETPGETSASAQRRGRAPPPPASQPPFIKQEEQFFPYPQPPQPPSVPYLAERLASLEDSQFWVQNYMYEQARLTRPDLSPPPARFRPPSPAPAIEISDSESDER